MKTVFLAMTSALIMVLSYTPVHGQCHLEIESLTVTYPDTPDCSAPTYDLLIMISHIDVSDSMELLLDGVLSATLPYASDTSSTILLEELPLHDSLFLFIMDQVDSTCSVDSALDLAPCIDSTQCAINNFVVEAGMCTSDSTYLIDLEFDPFGAMSDSFDLFINGDYHDNFAYGDLPLLNVEIGASMDTIDIVTVCLNDVPECCFIKELATPECIMGGTCSIRDIVVEDSCTDDGYYLVVDFIHEHTSDSFTLRGNGMMHGTYAYADLPVTLGVFADSLSLDELVVIDQVNSDCIEDVGFDVSCDICSIQDIVVEDSCTDDGYYLVVDFIHDNTSDSFLLRGNGMSHGTYAYADLPVTLGAFADSLSLDELVVIDQVNSDCIEDVGFDVSCDICSIQDIVVQDSCVDSGYVLIVNFVHENTGDSFRVSASDDALESHDLGTHAYDDLPVILGPFYSNVLLNSLVVDDVSHYPCVNDAPINIDCEGLMCRIDSIMVFDAYDQGDGTYSVILDFDPHRTSDSFLIESGPYSIGTYAYADLPLVLSGLPSRNLPEELIRIIDASDDECSGVIEFELEDCVLCTLDDLYVEVIACTDSTAELLIDLFPIGISISGFEILGDGQHYGQYTYSDLPVTIAADRDGNRGLNIIIRDLEHASCMTYAYVDSFDCGATTCTITSFDITEAICNEDSLIELSFVVEATGGSAGGFILFTTSDTVGPFAYGGSIYETSVPFPLTDDDPTLITLCDVDADTSCCTSVLLALPACMSSIHDTDQENGLSIRSSLGRWVLTVDDPGTIYLYDMAGRQVVSPTPIRTTLTITDLAPGAYVVRHHSDSGWITKRGVFLR